MYATRIWPRLEQRYFSFWPDSIPGMKRCTQKKRVMSSDAPAARKEGGVAADSSTPGQQVQHSSKRLQQRRQHLIVYIVQRIYTVNAGGAQIHLLAARKHSAYIQYNLYQSCHVQRCVLGRACVCDSWNQRRARRNLIVLRPWKTNCCLGQIRRVLPSRQLPLRRRWGCSQHALTATIRTPP